VVKAKAAETPDLNPLALGQSGAHGLNDQFDREFNVFGGELRVSYGKPLYQFRTSHCRILRGGLIRTLRPAAVQGIEL
jgi:hypothetical protein